MSVSPLNHKHVRPATVIVICFLATHRVKVTTGKGSLVQLDELNIRVSNRTNADVTDRRLTDR